jgi:hypothetical protein
VAACNGAALKKRGSDQGGARGRLAACSFIVGVFALVNPYVDDAFYCELACLSRSVHMALLVRYAILLCLYFGKVPLDMVLSVCNMI